MQQCSVSEQSTSALNYSNFRIILVSIAIVVVIIITRLELLAVT